MILAGSLIVSCQADPGSPFGKPEFIAAFAEAAVRGAAKALRLEGVANIRTVRAQQSVPLIGLTKRRGGEFGDIYITPDFEDVETVAAAGADIIAFDATTRERPVTVKELIETIHDHEKLALADVSTMQEAVWALEAGVDFVSTTLSGYTAYSPKLEGPDLKLISDLVALGIRPIAEGRIRNPEEAREAFERGAHAVVVGSAITRPEVVTGWFRDALNLQAAAP